MARTPTRGQARTRGYLRPVDGSPPQGTGVVPSEVCEEHGARCIIVGMRENDTGRSASAPDPEGLQARDLRRVRRDLFRGALEVARADHDPSSEWESFAEVAWREAALAFGFVERDEFPSTPENGR